MALSKVVVACNYPLYSVVDAGNGEVVVTGGGGQAKTGVPNGVEMHHLYLDSNYKCLSKCILQHNMGGDLIMNLVKHPVKNVLAGGIEHSMVLFQINRPHPGTYETDGVHLSKIQSVRTDFKEKQSYLNVLQFNYDGTLIITGGSDCTVRVWKFPSLQKIFELRQHENEVEHITSHISSDEVVSLCRKGEAFVWDLNKGKALKKFSSKSDTHRMKTCRYSKAGVSEKFCLYSCCVPIKIVKNRVPHSYLLKLCSSTWKEDKKSGMFKGLGCTLAVSSDGLQVAVGTNDGSIFIFNDNLKVLHKIFQVHSVFVTGLTFINLTTKLPPPNSRIDSESRKIILSVSADKTCCATVLLKAGNSGNLRRLVFVSFLLFLLCFIISMIIL